MRILRNLPTATRVLVTVGAMFLVITLGCKPARSEAAPAPAHHINSDRLQATLQKLSEFGRNPEGGVTRLGFSQAELDARVYVMDLMKEAALEVRVDPAGNIFGRRAGSAKLPILLFGSHIDSVPKGGAFDGSVGTLGAIEVIRALNDGHVKTRHPLEVVVWTNEEGPHFGVSALGSGVAAGSLGPEILDRKGEDGLTPGAVNVIPGRVEFPVELRDLDAAKIGRMWELIRQRFARTDTEEGVETQCVEINEIAPALSDPAVQNAIREAARSAGLSTADLPSGAVHDAGEIARIAPMGMIFVPSRDGISHAPQEFSSWDDIANGTEVLYRTPLAARSKQGGAALSKAPPPC